VPLPVTYLEAFCLRKSGDFRRSGLDAAPEKQRRALGESAELNGHLLQDIGLTRADALRAARRPFWN
jgi:hypothetical protein